MSVVSLTGVAVLNNPAPFSLPYKFEVSLESRQDLEEDLEWTVRYVGSASSTEYDQILDVVLVGPVREGRHKFVLEVPAPNPELIPAPDAVGVTIIILEGSYRSKCFLKLGYFLRQEYDDPELRENPPPVPVFEKLSRTILDTCPRLTVFPISWDNAEEEMMPPEERRPEESDGDLEVVDLEAEMEEEIIDESEDEDAGDSTDLDAID